MTSSKDKETKTKGPSASFSCKDLCGSLFAFVAVTTKLALFTAKLKRSKLRRLGGKMALEEDQRQTSSEGGPPGYSDSGTSASAFSGVPVKNVNSDGELCADAGLVHVELCSSAACGGDELMEDDTGGVRGADVVQHGGCQWRAISAGKGEIYIKKRDVFSLSAGSVRCC
jgi:hypothetical protein